MIAWKQKPAWKILLPLFLALFFLSLLSAKTLRAPWYEQWVWSALSPVVTLFSGIKQGSLYLWNHYLYLTDTTFENEALRGEVARLKGSLSQLQELKQENDRLTRLLELKPNRFPKSIAARVIAFDPRSEFRTIRVNKGSRDGVVPNLPVVAAQGLVGKVGPVFGHDAYVLLVVDPSSHVDVMVQRPAVRTLLSGSGLLKHTRLKHGYFLTQLEYLKKESDVAAGDVVVTSGLDQLYPPGIMVGAIESVEKDREGLFLEARVLPAVDFSKLREVLILEK